MVSNVQLEELADVIKSTPSYSGSRYIAKLIAERIVEAGWTPPKVELTEEEEVELVDRIIHGLPVKFQPNKPVLDVVTLPNGVQLVDVVSAHPHTNWKRIPDFDNYEIDQLGNVRNRFTRRIIETTDEGGVTYVEMHDKEGFPHIVSVAHQVQVVFGEV